MSDTWEIDPAVRMIEIPAKCVRFHKADGETYAVLEDGRFIALSVLMSETSDATRQ